MRGKRTSGEKCKAKINFGSDHLDSTSSFWCDLEEGHEGKHSESGVMPAGDTEDFYTITWETKQA